MSVVTIKEPEVSAWARPAVAILGVPFDNVTKAEALERIERMIISKQPHYLVTPNVDFLVQARGDIELRRILSEAHLVLCDGTPLVWVSKLLGNGLPERVAGADIVPLLIGLAEQKGYRLFLLGATRESSSAAVSQLLKKHPKLVIAGHYAPAFNRLLEMDHEEIKPRVLEATPDILLVSFGCPKQEKWIAMHYRSLGVPVVIGVGATIDFLAGQVKRAPVWMQQSGTEWLFRLAQEPRRLCRRYLTDLWTFGGSICLQWWRLKAPVSRQEQLPTRAQSLADAGDSFEMEASFQCLRLPPRLDLAAICHYGQLLEQNLDPERHCLVNMSTVNFIDSTGVGFLIRLLKTMRAAGRHLVLLSPGPSVRRALNVMRLEQFFLCAPDLAAARALLEDLASQRSSGVTRTEPATQTTIAWHGEITAANAEAIGDQAGLLLQASSAVGAWTIDLGDVRFIDSTGLGLMVRMKKLAQKNQRTITFSHVQPAVRNVVRIARLEKLLLEPGD